jgi:hypothetical protein
MFESREIFFRSVDTCNALYRSGHDLSLYREIIRLHREINDLSILLEKDEFYELIFRTLEAWNMNQRGARLTDIDNFKKSVQSLQKYLLYLYQQPLHLIPSLPDTAIICPRNEEQGFNVLKY